MAELAMAEATLLAVEKDDPYPGVVMRDRSKSDREWMIMAPEIPKVRAHLFARLCVAAGEHAARAEALFLSSGSTGGTTQQEVDEDVLGYVGDLRKTARGRACRFLGIDEELGGGTGRAIAWLRGAKRELGMMVEEEEGRWRKLKKGLDEKREDRRVEKGGEWGGDGGRMEEWRVVEMLERKWVRENDTINTQLVPPFEPLLAGMPSGREIHSSTTYVPPELDADVLEKMRAPPDPDEAGGLADDGSDSSDDEGPAESGPPGAFPVKATGGTAASEYY
ncbi:MAG: hypothetical protein Q9219_004880 [cf. Caloplaca sp. 3 TL-2023]